MYSPELTLESGIEEIGPAWHWAEWSFGKGNPLVEAHRESTKALLDFVGRFPGAIQKQFFGWGISPLLQRLPEAQPFIRAYDRARGDLQSAWAKSGMIDFLWTVLDDQYRYYISKPRDEMPEDMRAQLNFTMQKMPKSLKEILWNCIEHGSNCGDLGEVVVRGVCNDSSEFMFAMDQPVAFDTEGLKSKQWTVDIRGDLSGLRGGVPRGRGLNCILGRDAPRVNFVQLQQGGMRTLLLGTLADARRKTRLSGGQERT